MKNKFFKAIAGVFLFFAIIIAALIIYNTIQTSKYRDPVDGAYLSPEEQAHSAFVLRLKNEHGSQIWPGFDTCKIPMILFNDQYEFIHTPDSSVLPGRSELTKDGLWYRRNSEDPQAFAVRLNDTWAGSLGVERQMNREMYNGIKGEMPSFISRIFPFFLISVSEEMHVAGIVHEMFHAYQGICNEEKFLEAESAHRYLKDYPYDNAPFTALWNREGTYLQKALYAANEETVKMYADSFLVAREERRNLEGVKPDHLRAEKQLEWLEGTAKYTESVSYRIAGDLDSERYTFKRKNPYWERERNQRLASLGEEGGDNRFYHSGAAMAFLLDRFVPSWKDSVMKDAVYLEDLLASATR